jgi:hypothetical protein
MAEVDPNLELHELAQQAVQYSRLLKREQHVRQTSTPSSDQDGTVVSFTDRTVGSVRDDPRFVCPFPTCNRRYKRKDLLKRHLTTLATSPDEHHHDTAIWDDIRETSIMTIYTRPRNLTEEQKKQRRKDSNARHRAKYKDELKEKRNRKRRVEKLLEGKQVGTQTPDWDAEAKESSAAMEVAAAAASVVAQSSSSSDLLNANVGLIDPEVTGEAHPRMGRRMGRQA